MKRIKVIYQGEALIISEDQLGGYAGAEALGEASAADCEACPYLLASPEHLASVHIQKAIEAALIASGYRLTAGLLAAEAEALGIGLEALAEQVLAKRKDERSFEVERRQRKVSATTKGNRHGI